VPGPGIPGAGIPPARQSRRTLWIVLGIVGGVVIIGIILFVVVAANASNPTKTLQAYCNALKSNDYQTAYDQFSKSLQDQFTEAQYAQSAQSTDSQVGGINNCTVSNVNESGSSASGTITFFAGNGNSGDAHITLTNENNSWKITNIH
jgi:predicted PurR-regulated permease PerM